MFLHLLLHYKKVIIRSQEFVHDGLAIRCVADKLADITGRVGQVCYHETVFFMNTGLKIGSIIIHSVIDAFNSFI